MSLLLNLLEREANRLYEGEEEPDYELLRDIMHYMTIYPDVVHHPKEDRLYAEVKTVRPDLSAGFDRITLDHRGIAELGLRLRDDLEGINSGSFVRRKAVVADALRYVNTLRNHMQWEELDLFRRCEEMAAGGHDVIVEARLIPTSDPLFGDTTEERFRRLLRGIEDAAGLDRD